MILILLVGGLLVSAAPGPSSRKLELRFLIIATNDQDLGLAPLRSLLQQIGAPFDVLYAANDPLTDDRLVRPDGTGRYNAVLLTSSNLVYNTDGKLVGALDMNEWNRLWQYERDFQVRQLALFAGASQYPEDYCLELVTQATSDAQGIPSKLTSLGSQVFNYLRPDAQIPVRLSYLYLTKIKADCSAQPILTDADGKVLGVLSTSPDGRERMALTFTQNANLLHTQLLGYGMINWVSRGMFVGEMRRYLGLDVDDWFDGNPWRIAVGTFVPGGYRMTARDAWSVYQQQLKIRQKYPLVGDFTIAMAFNGGGYKPAAPESCDPNVSSVDSMSSITHCLKDKFRWINHTFSHILMDTATYDAALKDITRNIEAGKALGLDFQTDMVKTGEFSGLGWKNAQGDASLKTDNGLEASNPDLLRAAKEAGIRYMHANMSVPSHQPSCWNCVKPHPLEPSITMIPVWPINIAYDVTTPQEALSLYNATYGPKGSQPYWPKDLTYSEMIAYEASISLTHILKGSIYPHYLHQSNLREYNPGKSLAFDWLEAVVKAYSSYFRVPLENPDWPKIIAYTQQKTAHFKTAETVSAVWNPADGSINLTGQPGAVFVTGADTGDGNTQTYYQARVALVSIQPNTAVTLKASPLTDFRVATQ